MVHAYVHGLEDIKIEILPILIGRLNIFSIVLSIIFIEIEYLIIECMWKGKGTKI